MGIGVSLILIAVGAILTWAVSAEVSGVDIQTIGVILLIVGEATQQALLGEDFSVVHAAVVITTLLVLSRVFDYLSWRYDWFQRATESVPVVLVDNGRPLDEVLRRHRLSEEDILTAGREAHGIERMDQVKWAVMETSGGISVVPYAAADT